MSLNKGFTCRTSFCCSLRNNDPKENWGNFFSAESKSHFATAKYTLTGQIHLHILLIGIADCIPYLTILNTSPRVTWRSKKSVCVSRKVYQRSQRILGSSRTGWPFCDKAFTFGCSQEAAETLITHSPPAFFTPLSSQLPIHPWTLDQIVCLFSFLSQWKLLAENWI